VNCHQNHCRQQLVFYKEREILWIWKKKLSQESQITPADDTREWEAEVCVVSEWVFIQIQYSLPFNTSCLFLSLFTMSSKDENNKVAYKKDLEMNNK